MAKPNRGYQGKRPQRGRTTSPKGPSDPAPGAMPAKPTTNDKDQCKKLTPKQRKIQAAKDKKGNKK